MTAAQAKLSAGDAPGAIALLEERLRVAPDDARAAYALGTTLHGQGEHARALELFERAAALPGLRANACYNAACACARLGQLEPACAWLERALAAGFRNVQLLLTDADLSGIRDSQAYRSLLPIGAAATFLEPVRILLELRGEASGDRFGWIGRNAGDTDGDGVADIWLSAPFHGAGGSNAGKVYLYSGKTGALRFAREGAPGDLLGMGLEAAGDVDGDGVGDLCAGAPGARGTGAAFVYSGVDGKTLLELAGEAPGDLFGRRVAGAGDQDGDGHADVLVGAPNHDGAGADAGRVVLFSGKDGARLVALDGGAAGEHFGQAVDGCARGEQRLLVVGASDAGGDQRGRVIVYRWDGESAREAFRIEGASGDRELGGMFVSVVGDVDGDGLLDVYASDWNSGAAGRPSAGRVYVHSGADGRRLHVLDGEQPGDCFGIGTAEAGDADGDGCDDLLIGAWQHSSGAGAGGCCTLFSGKTGATLGVTTCATFGDTFGFDTTGLGDVDGDGVGDFLITAADSFVNGPQSGRVLVLAGPARR